MVHEAGETARSTIEVFKSQPLLLAMVLMNFALLGFLYYTGVTNNKSRARELELLYQNRKEVGQLLIECHRIPAELH